MAWLAVTLFAVGGALSWIGIDADVTHNAHVDDSDLAFLWFFIVYVPGALLVLLALLVGLTRTLRIPALVVIALADLGVGLAWGRLAWPGDPSCKLGCLATPTVTTVLLWSAVAVHVMTAAIFAFGLRRPES